MTVSFDSPKKKKNIYLDRVEETNWSIIMKHDPVKILMRFSTDENGGMFLGWLRFSSLLPFSSVLREKEGERRRGCRTRLLSQRAIKIRGSLVNLPPWILQSPITYPIFQRSSDSIRPGLSKSANWNASVRSKPPRVTRRHRHRNNPTPPSPSL